MWEKLIRFFKSGSKISFFVFIGIMGVVVAVTLYTSGIEAYRKWDARQYEVVKEWPLDRTIPLQLKFVLRTKLVDGEMFASLAVDGFPKFLSDPVLAARNRDGSFNVFFKDIDGFDIFNKTIPMSDFTTIVDDKGQKTGLHIQFREHLAADSYRRFDNLSIGWKLVTEAPPVPKPVSSPTMPNVSSDDPCAPNLTRSERIKRLAAFGTIKQTGSNSFAAGRKSVSFYSDGELMLCD